MMGLSLPTNKSFHWVKYYTRLKRYTKCHYPIGLIYLSYKAISQQLTRLLTDL